ncbi:MAG: hypothetical protein ACON5E_05535 [Flavobacteriales bacterium]
MKNLINGVLFLAIVGTSLFYSCSKNQAIVEKRNLEMNESIFLFPEGTEFNVLENTENKMEFVLPNGFEFITLNYEQTKIKSTTNGGNITCNCTSSDGGCKPFAAGGYLGCFTEGCSTCIGTTSNSNSSRSSINFIKIPIHSTVNSIFNSLSGFSDYRYITDVLEWVSTPYISSNIDEHLNQELDKMLEAVWEVPLEDISLNDETVYTPIYANGYKLLMAIPLSKLDEGSLYIPRKANNMSSSASCSGCSGDCKLQSRKLGAIVFCDGCDSGCTLSTGKSK